MIDASHIKIHPDMAGTKGDNQEMGFTNAKIHLAVDAHGMSVRVIITSGITADCSQAKMQNCLPH